MIEAYTDANVGSSALVGNSIKICRALFPKSCIRVMAHHPQSIEAMHNCYAVKDPFDYPFNQPRSKQIIWLIKQVIWMALAWKSAVNKQYQDGISAKILNRSIKNFLWADIVISVGAERLNDKFYKIIPFSVFSYLLCKRMGKRVVLFPQTIGPLFFNWSRWLVTRALQAVDLIYVRDEESYSIVVNQLGINSSKVILTSDVAVLQEPISLAEARQLIGMDTEEKIVGISALRWTYFKNKAQTPYSNYESYKREMAHLADALINKYQVNIVFFPTNFPMNGCREDDVRACEDIQSLMVNKDRARIIRKLPSPAELQGMLRCCEINITTRMHACILSTSVYVPTISVNYLFKIKEYMKSVGLGEFAIDIEDFHSGAVLPLFDRLWREREVWQSRLETAINNKRKLLMQTMESINA